MIFWKLWSGYPLYVQGIIPELWFRGNHAILNRDIILKHSNDEFSNSLYIIFRFVFVMEMCVDFSMSPPPVIHRRRDENLFYFNEVLASLVIIYKVSIQ